MKSIAAMALCLLLGCGSTVASPPVSCAPGDVGECACAGGSPGTATCDAAGVFGACTCVDLSGTTVSGGPTFLTFGATLTAMTVDDSITFTAIVSHPEGTDSLAGGSLLSADSTVHYGPFGTGGAQKGAYSITLSWSQINKSSPIDFATEEHRIFVAEFFDTHGRKATKTISIRLHCGGKAVCGGACTSLETDSNNCGQCKHACGNGGCSGGACFGNFRSKSAQTCQAICQLNNGTCGAPPCDASRVGYAEYRKDKVWGSSGAPPISLTSCTQVPPAAHPNAPEYVFSEQGCCCALK